MNIEIIQTQTLVDPFDLAKKTLIHRGDQSKVISCGKHSYGLNKLLVSSWLEGTHVFIGSFVSLAKGIHILLGGNHRVDWGTTYPFGILNTASFPNGLVNGPTGHPSSNGHVVIGHDTWIGANATILSGVNLAHGCVVAANSVVTRDVAPYTIVGGNPAKVIRRRFDDTTINGLLDLKWWNLDDVVINQIIPELQSNFSSQVLETIRQKVIRSTIQNK